MTVPQFIYLIVFVAMVIFIWLALRTARRALALANSILELGASEPAAAAREWRPKEEVRSAVVDALTDGQPHSIRMLTSAHTTSVTGTPLQRYQTLAQLAQEGRITVRGPLTLAANVRLRRGTSRR